MKDFILSAGLVLAIAGSVLADAGNVTVVNQVGATNSVTSAKMNGFLEAFVIDVSGTTTQTITAVSSRTGETVLTKTTSADVVVRPRITANTVAGATTGGSNDLVRFYLSNDALVFTVTETAATTNSTGITILTSK